MIHVAIPAIDEAGRLPACLDALAQQTVDDFRVLVCVNQPEAWRDDPARQTACEGNLATLALLAERSDLQLEIIDRCRPGRGWPRGRGGVGWARKVLIDRVLETADDEDLLVSLDADSLVAPDYLAAVRQRFRAAPAAVGLAAPYLHPLTGGRADRDILRYELYLRHYLLCQLKTGSFWAFTALGSAMAVPLGHCRRVGGMSPKSSGEDFYFLQKLRKFGPLLLWCAEPVRPAARYSDRVLFGTGPAMIAGRGGEWHRYPVYDVGAFREAAAAVALFPRLHRSTVETPLTPYCRELFGAPDPWEPLRKNHPGEDSFIRACHERFDGLRLLRFLRLRRAELSGSDEERLLEGVHWYAPEIVPAVEAVIGGGGFTEAPIGLLALLRDQLAQREDQERKRHDRKLFGETAC